MKRFPITVGTEAKGVNPSGFARENGKEAVLETAFGAG